MEEEEEEEEEVLYSHGPQTVWAEMLGHRVCGISSGGKKWFQTSNKNHQLV
jgi:hypothetical protein